MKTRGQGVPLSALCASLEGSSRVARAPGTAVFLTSDPDLAPSALRQNLKHNAVLHEKDAVLTVHVSTRLRVPHRTAQAGRSPNGMRPDTAMLGAAAVVILGIVPPDGVLEVFANPAAVP